MRTPQFVSTYLDKLFDLCRVWTTEEKAEWEQTDRQEKDELEGHVKALTTSQEHHLPGNPHRVWLKPDVL